MLTISAIKADVGSIGGHTLPSYDMLNVVRVGLNNARVNKTIIDFDVTHTGDDICLLMIHSQGNDSKVIHDLAWNILMEATEIAKEQGLYGAGQDMLADAPSGNVRGAGPGAAEITFDPSAKERKAEPFLIFAGDKCGPGAFNFPLYSVFTNPMYNAGLMLPYMIKGFKFTLVDMEHAGEDRVAGFNAPEELYQLASLLRDENKYGIKAIHSREYPHQQAVAVSTDRLHTIAGVYKGKDDPVAIVRAQQFFPAPEEIVSPYAIVPFVAGDARGSHHMPWMPMPINSQVAGLYCLPIVSCIAYSVTKEGKLSDRADLFGDAAWDFTRLKAQEKGIDMRHQGFFGAAMLPYQELEYSAMKETIEEADKRFKIVETEK